MSWPSTIKVLLVSSAVAFMALALKLSVPMVIEFSLTQVPLMWSCLISWLRPPYLYVIINGIIISIAASSRFHPKGIEDRVDKSSPEKISSDLGYAVKISAEISPEFLIAEPPAVYEQREEVIEVKAIEANSSREVKQKENHELLTGTSSLTPPSRVDSWDFYFPEEKPPVSSRFSHRKPAKASPEGGKSLRVSKPKKHETLENTWKTITDGRAMPLSRHMKKCETWENHGRPKINLDIPDPSPVKKSETFKDRTNQQVSPVNQSPGAGKMRKEPSLSQDELNRRVEAFIKKFNDEMRMQRQESLNQYKEMMGRH